MPAVVLDTDVWSFLFKRVKGTTCSCLTTMHDMQGLASEPVLFSLRSLQNHWICNTG
jgi:hypothetical protein